MIRNEKYIFCFVLFCSISTFSGCRNCWERICKCFFKNSALKKYLESFPEGFFLFDKDDEKNNLFIDIDGNVFGNIKENSTKQFLGKITENSSVKIFTNLLDKIVFSRGKIYYNFVPDKKYWEEKGLVSIFDLFTHITRKAFSNIVFVNTDNVEFIRIGKLNYEGVYAPCTYIYFKNEKIKFMPPLTNKYNVPVVLETGQYVFWYLGDENSENDIFPDKEYCEKNPHIIVGLDKNSEYKICLHCGNFFTYNEENGKYVEDKNGQIKKKFIKEIVSPTKNIKENLDSFIEKNRGVIGLDSDVNGRMDEKPEILRFWYDSSIPVRWCKVFCEMFMEKQEKKNYLIV